MDLEAQDVTPNFRFDTYFKPYTFFTLSFFLHFLLISTFVYQSKPKTLLSEKKIFIQLEGGRFENKISSQRLTSASSPQLKKMKHRSLTGFHSNSELNSGSSLSDQNNLPTANFETNYPRLSRLFKEQGEVVFKIKNSHQKDGLNFELIKSSSFKRLDLAAEEALEKNKKKILELIENQNIENIRFEFKLAEKNL